MKLLRHFFCDFSLQQMPMVRRLFKDKRNGSITHKIDPLVDGERDNIGGSLQKSNKSEEPNLLSSTGPGAGAKNATGDGYQSDGRLLLFVLQ
jgi:hypothetical protein